MAMEKYGVSDRKEQQRKALAKAEEDLKKLNQSQEKTASDAQEAKRLTNWISELNDELTDQ